MKEKNSAMNDLEAAYDQGTFGVSRRTFLKLAAVTGVCAAGGLLVFPDQEAAAAFTAPSSPQWPTLSGSKVRFTVHSDTHVGAGEENAYREKVPAAFSAIYGMAPQVHGHFFVGDSADNGTADDYDKLAELLNAHAKSPVGIVMGNHEYYAHSGSKDSAQAEFKEFLSSKLTVAGSFQIPGGANEGQTDCDFVVGGTDAPGSGYHVIALSSHPGGYDNSWYGDRQDWVRERVAAAVAEDASKPVFLLTHHPFGNTVWYSVGGSWNGKFGTDSSDVEGNDDAFYKELAGKYHQLIHFSGHTHIPMADPRSIYQDDGFTLIQTATFANNFWMSGDGLDETGSGEEHPNAGQDASQCELVEIDTATHAVTIHRLDFRNGAALGQPWVIVPSQGRDGFRYTHAGMEQAAKPPLVKEGASVSVPEETISDMDASFALTADKVSADASGVNDDVVISYRVTVARASAPDAPVFNARFMSDYYKADVNQPAVFERPLFGAALEEKTAYVLRAYAVSAFGKEALVGETEFTTAEKVPPSLGAPLLHLDFATGAHDDRAAKPHAAVPFGALTYETDSAFGVPVALFDGESAVGYEFADKDYAAIAQAETIEVLFQFTAEPTDTYFDLFSSASGVGQDLSYYAPKLRHYTNVGNGSDYVYTDGEVPLNTWTHVTVTYDGETMKYYLNGQLVSQKRNVGSIPAPKADFKRWFVGADVDSEGGMEHPMVGKVAFAKLTPVVATQEQATMLYTASAPVAKAAEAPSAEEMGTATVGQAYLVPNVLFTDVAGTELQAVPEVTDPNGQAIELMKTAAEAAALAEGTLSASAHASYRFVPAAEGTYVVTYLAGYAQRPTAEVVVSAAPAPEPGEGGDTGNGGNAGGNGEGGGTGNGGNTGGGNAGGNGAGGGNAPDAGTTPGTGSGANGAGGSSGAGANGSTETVTLPTGTKLAQTGDELSVATSALIGLVATAGAAACVARGFLKGEFSGDDGNA
ncbi:LamG-like jellyroll fold domain-containing protein [Adlercreutzia sp. ZJ242]|uniref:LamG-like jellyroll fold domain-containing protein n=1 Tax=Adlercreutzia sp. ZJ242 TaxID=2709409 RepID=UPI001F149B1C|nr:LamG-like jellyroll fold domain-containing protein [Adlercreutzia sp. ZJ242]